MKSLINTISQFPVCTESEWRLILSIGKHPSLENLYKITLKKQQALIAESRARGMYVHVQRTNTLIETALPRVLKKLTSLARRIMAENNNQAIANPAPLQINGDSILVILIGLVPHDLTPIDLLTLFARIQSVLTLLGLLKEKNPLQLAQIGQSEYLLTVLAAAVHENYPRENGNGHAVRESKEECDPRLSALISKTQQREQHKKPHLKPFFQKPDSAALFNRHITQLAATQDETTFCFLISQRLLAYQTVLRDYIRQELIEHPHLTIYYFNQMWTGNFKLDFTPDPVMNIIYDTDRELFPRTGQDSFVHAGQERAKLELNTLIRKNPAFGRALANYALTENALRKLTYYPPHDSAQPSPAARLQELFKCYPDISKHFQDVGNRIVDNATHGLRRFCKRIWVKLKYYFSAMRQHEIYCGQGVLKIAQRYRHFQIKKPEVLPREKVPAEQHRLSLSK
jgi:hypothetical protein